MRDSTKGLIIPMDVLHAGKKCSAFLKKEVKLPAFLVKLVEKYQRRVPGGDLEVERSWEVFSLPGTADPTQSTDAGFCHRRGRHAF